MLGSSTYRGSKVANRITIRDQNTRFRNARVFLRAWLRDPRYVGAIASSSRGLAGLITVEISGAFAPVLELGPGTGVFTRALLARGVPEDQLTLVECDAGFARILQSQFPAARVLHLDATRLRGVDLFDGEGVGAVVSGLPLLSMSGRKVMAILDGAFQHMRPGAAFYQFTYGPRCPVRRSMLDRLGLKAKRLGFTLANVPPAAVYRIRRRQPRLSVDASDGITRQAANVAQYRLRSESVEPNFPEAPGRVRPAGKSARRPAGRVECRT